MHNQPGDQPKSDPIAAEIEAEIADHLATATERLAAQGFEPTAAEKQSQDKFGDAAAIGRRCYWIKQGDTLMFRTAIIVLLAALFLALGFTTYSSLHAQRQMAEQMTALAEQLKTLADQQKSPPSPAPPAAEPKPLEITGQVFLGTPDKPSANTEVMVCRAGDAEIVRRISTSNDGSFKTGPLTTGDYTLIAKSATKMHYPHMMGIQTAPIFVYPETPVAEARIDASYHGGRIAVALSNPLPSLNVEGKYKIDSRLYLTASTTRTRNTRWKADQNIPAHWPIYIENPDDVVVTDRNALATWKRSAVLSNLDIGIESKKVTFTGYATLPAGPFSITATIVTDVWPERGAVRITSPNTGWLFEEGRWLSMSYLQQHGLGAAWLGKLQGANGPNGLQSNFNRFSRIAVTNQEIEIVEGKATVLQIEVPTDTVNRFQNLIDTMMEPAEFAAAVRKDDPFVHPPKITILGTEPLTDESQDAPTPANGR